MTHLFLLLLVATVMTSCGTPVREGGDPSAETLKTEVDGVAKQVLPQLTDALGVKPTGLQADFIERGGFGLWDYGASGQFVAPQGTPDVLAESITKAMTDVGLSVKTDSLGAVVGSRGNVVVRLTVGTSVVPGSSRTMALVDISIGSRQPTSEGEDFAESAPPEDYLAFVE